MFTGLVEGLGVVRRLERGGEDLRLVVESPVSMGNDFSIGDSVAFNGCCLTLVEHHAMDSGGMSIVVEAGAETLQKTNLGDLEVGHAVNLERALKADARLGGHFVQGHIDGVGTIQKIERHGEWIDMTFKAAESLTQLMVEKGSIAVDGVSLTVVNVDADSFSVALIPHTLEETTLGDRKVGDAVNLETDVLGKYVQKLLAQRV
ncbi:riboflavin synthase [Stratiformator vulcanicus]|uniref:Riboflavin synthase n=1 Tax=Stratiformator vulcanicus TaxID=2527980 RepID=A0A517QXR3_9PLAN|nr:riboflavin synthase [Stratiformator vulcanicus]QDT36429.1 Riboflavin synthase [Stratiformator vulcanicus]